MKNIMYLTYTLACLFCFLGCKESTPVISLAGEWGFSIMPAAQITVSKQKASYPYLLYLPKEYSTNDKDFPLVIYLGGGSQNGNDLNKLKTYGIPFYIEQGHEYNFIIASPQCPEKKYWTTENWFDSLYTDLVSTYRIDTTRIYVTGISNGGFGTWQVAMDYPHKFAAIAPLCGGVNDKDTANLDRLKQLPIWTFHGTADDMIPIRETERVVNKLEAYGHIKFTRLQNEGHGIQYLYENNEIFDWLLQHSLKKNLHSGKLLNQKTYALMTSKQPGALRNHPIFGETFYGYGITVDTTDHQLQVGQTGLVPGFASMDFYFPKTNQVFVKKEHR